MRPGVERCRVCGAAAGPDRLCSPCTQAAAHGDRALLLERGAAYMLSRFPILRRDEPGFRLTLAAAHERMLPELARREVDRPELRICA
jgi:hypothetical protein